MRILFTSTAGTGHLNPLLPVARAARAAGHDVRFALPSTALAHVNNLGFTADRTGTGRASDDEMIFWRGLPAQADGNTYVMGYLFGGIRVREAFEPMREIVEEFRPDVIVSEQCEFAGWIHAELRGIPHVTVAIASTEMPGADLGPMTEQLNLIRTANGLAPISTSPWEHRTRFMCGVPAELRQPGEVLPDNTLHYQYEDAEGPAVPQRRRPKTKLRVYATLGTAAAHQPQFTTIYGAVLAGLGSVDGDMIFTVGMLDPTKLGRVPANIRIESYLPQAATMAEVDVVVSHGGSGTSSAALARGIPTVNVPLFADQPFNAERIAALGAGVTVDPRRVATDLAPAIATVASDPSYRAAAERAAAANARLPLVARVLDEMLAGVFSTV